LKVDTPLTLICRKSSPNSEISTSSAPTPAAMRPTVGVMPPDAAPGAP
jgi:hypothetical protein